MARFTRREIFAALTAGGVLPASACRRTTQHAAAGVTPAGDITTWSVGTMADAIRRRQISSYELVSACLRQIDRVNPRLNGVVRLRAEDALAEARRADEHVSRGALSPTLWMA